MTDGQTGGQVDRWTDGTRRETMWHVFMKGTALGDCFRRRSHHRSMAEVLHLLLYFNNLEESQYVNASTLMVTTLSSLRLDLESDAISKNCASDNVICRHQIRNTLPGP